MASCTHLDQVHCERADQVAGCAECLAAGGTWVHLRVCRTCGQIGCCDSSPSRHTFKHARAGRHPIITSVEPDEFWSYCFVDDVVFALRSDA